MQTGKNERYRRCLIGFRITRTEIENTIRRLAKPFMANEEKPPSFRWMEGINPVMNEGQSVQTADIFQKFWALSKDIKIRQLEKKIISCSNSAYSTH